MIRRRDIGFTIYDLRFTIYERQLYDKPASLAHFALDAHTAAMRLDDVFDDAQADAHTGRLAALLGAEAVEALEDFLLFPVRNARAVVGDGKDEG